MTLLLEWAGNDNMATYEYTGGNHPSDGDQRLPENLFDKDPFTHWQGFPNQFNATLTVNFVQPVLFQYMDWTIREDVFAEQALYRGACLYAGEQEIDCFTDEIIYKAGETYRITGNVVHSKFVFKMPKEGTGAEMEIGYKRDTTIGNF